MIICLCQVQLLDLKQDMVFHCRCFSFVLQEDGRIKCETTAQPMSTSTEAYHTVFLNNDSETSAGTSYYTASSDSAGLDDPAENPPSTLRVFMIAELKAATQGFCRASKINEGRFGSVYKGVIKSLEHPFHEIQVVVKPDKGLLQGRKEREAEINVLRLAKHQNLVKLIGYCVECYDGLLLVYEYMVNGSVRDHLSAKSETPLSWDMRLQVAQDAARGLTYLHEQMKFEIILRDFKSSSILLDDQWTAKISDFGLAHLGPQIGLTHVTSNKIEHLGSMGYIAPECFKEGHHTSKSDVWSYGVFLYELITGRSPLEMHRPENGRKLLEWVKPYLESQRFQQILDPRLESDYPLESAKRLCNIANMCLSESPEFRPKTSEVLTMVNQLIIMFPPLEVDPNKDLFGSTKGERPTEETKHEGQKCSMTIQLKKPECLPQIHPVKLLKYYSKKCCCVSLH